MENSSNTFYLIDIKKKENLFYRNIAQILQAKGETIHRVTAVPTNDESVLKEEQTTEKLSLNEGTITNS